MILQRIGKTTTVQPIGRHQIFRNKTERNTGFNRTGLPESNGMNTSSLRSAVSSGESNLVFLSAFDRLFRLNQDEGGFKALRKIS